MCKGHKTNAINKAQGRHRRRRVLWYIFLPNPHGCQMPEAALLKTRQDGEDPHVIHLWSNWKQHQGGSTSLLPRFGNSLSNALPSWEPWGSLTALCPCFLSSFTYNLLNKNPEGVIVHFKWVNCTECELCLNWNKHLRGAKQSSSQPGGNCQTPQQRMQQGEHSIKGKNWVAFHKQGCQIHPVQV